MKRVAVYRSLVLPKSETFIREQIGALNTWEPLLVGNTRQIDGLNLSNIKVKIPRGNPRVRRNVQRLGLADVELSKIFQAQANIVHAHFGTDAVDIWPSVKRAGLPMVVTLHGYDIMTHASWWRSGHGGWGRIFYPARLIRLFGEPRVGFIAVSDAIREQAIQWGLSSDKIATRHIGIDVSKFQPTDVPAGRRNRRVLFVGRLVEKKGVRYLIEAMARVRRQVPDAVLTVVGDGPLRASLATLAEHLRVPIEFLGALDDLQVRAQLNHARVFCLPSVVAANGDAEGFGMVLLEAQACGVPVVTSARGGAKEGILQGRTGFAFAERDVDALAVALTKLLTDDALCDAMSAEAVAFVRGKFDIQALTPALETFYDQACERVPITPGEWR